MKQGDAKTMAIILKGLNKYDVDSVRVIFKQRNNKDSKILKEAIWNSDGSGDMERVGEVLKIFWSERDTYMFAGDNAFYADFQIRLIGSDDMPSVKQAYVYMDSTMFSKEEAFS